MKVDIPEIKMASSLSAKEVFSIDDPVGDADIGGQYVSPSGDLFEQRVADLLSFRILEDSTKVYFELQFSNLQNFYTKSDVGLGDTFSCILIHTEFGSQSKVQFSGNALVDGTYEYTIIVGNGIVVLEDNWSKN